MPFKASYLQAVVNVGYQRSAGRHRLSMSCAEVVLLLSILFSCTDEDIEVAKKALVGPIMQQPPMYSAVSIKGERLYKAARRGQHFLGLCIIPVLTHLSISHTCQSLQLS